MASPIRSVVGLGNPGPRYARTRHNVGFWFVDELAARAGTSFRPEAKFFGETCEIACEGRVLRLLKPQTYMNRSGQSVAALARYFQLPPEALLIVHDEVDLAPGVVRLKCGGGHAGHNGLRDIVAHLGSAEFVRLRVGVGHPGHKDQVHDHVLHPAGAEEERILREGIETALGLFPQIAAGEIGRVMNVLNRRRRISDEEAQPSPGTDGP